MLEIPESSTIALQLSKAVSGKTVRNVYTNVTPHGFAFFSGDPSTYHDCLSGQTVVGVHALAGLIELGFAGPKLVLGDDLSIRYLVFGESLPEKYQLHIEFEDDSSLICTVKMYAQLSTIPER
jgi:formamidopyrimidine-DNA glycosylase